MSSNGKQFPFLNLKKMHAQIANELGPALTRVFEHGQFINGPELKTFEYKWADFCGAGFAIGASNGTTALHAILEKLNIIAGDEVIMPSHTFIATAEAIRMTGATPVFAEIDDETMLMDPKAVEKLIRSRTKAIVPVHLYGNVCDMDALKKIAAPKGIPIIEDAAQAHGATYKKKPAGSLGQAAAFSFFPGKNLGAFGDAGAITTSDGDLHMKIRRYINHGREEKYEHTEMGTNYRMDTIQAAILLVKLRYLREWNKRRRAVAAKYDEMLSEEPFKSFPVKLMKITEGCEPVYHIYPIRVPHRDKVIAGLKERGVATGVHYPIPCHLQPALKEITPGEGALLKTEKTANSLISMPMCPTMTPDDAEQICNILRVVIMDLDGKITGF